jgi:hypothetical protein
LKTHIETRTVTSTSAEIFNNVFSATYDNYKIVTSGTLSTAGGMVMRLRAAGSDNSTANSYVIQFIDAGGASISTGRTTSTSWSLVGYTATLVNASFSEVVNPFKSSPTGVVSTNIRADSGGYLNPTAGTHNQTVSYDGFSLLPTQPFTGTIRVYGYKN